MVRPSRIAAHAKVRVEERSMVQGARDDEGHGDQSEQKPEGHEDLEQPRR
jgi:hypothetical protein